MTETAEDSLLWDIDGCGRQEDACQDLLVLANKSKLLKKLLKKLLPEVHNIKN